MYAKKTKEKKDKKDKKDKGKLKIDRHFPARKITFIPYAVTENSFRSISSNQSSSNQVIENC